MKLVRAAACLVWVGVMACDDDAAVIASEKIDKPTTQISTDPPDVDTDAPEVPDTDSGTEEAQ